MTTLMELELGFMGASMVLPPQHDVWRHLKVLRLPGASLSVVPPAIADTCAQLRVLELTANDDLVTVPAGVYLRHLESLEVSRCSFFGVPASLHHAKALRYLDMSYNANLQINESACVHAAVWGWRRMRPCLWPWPDARHLHHLNACAHAHSHARPTRQSPSTCCWICRTCNSC